ncbi:MAG: hypothetical protein Q9217_001396 [Psora testacea]
MDSSGSSDESQDEIDVSGGDVERDVEDENMEEDEENSMDEERVNRSRAAPTSAPSSAHALPIVRPEALKASVYDIVPTIAAPHSTSINAVTSTPDLRWVFSGGSDGYIRKFNWIETANGKSMLTVAQRHPFVDSVTKAGVLVSYWENNNELNEIDNQLGKPLDDSASISAVYSLAVQREALWLLSGLESGGINLQSVRHDEGKRIACLRGHTSAISVLNLASDEKSFLSGSWDKTVLDWDLNTGKTIRSFEGSGSQISALETRPLSTLPVPEISDETLEMSRRIFANNAEKPQTNGILPNGFGHDGAADAQDGDIAINGNAGSPADSLFGGNGDADSLFGDTDNMAAPGGAFDDDDNDFTRAIASGLQEQEHEQAQESQGGDAKGDIDMADPGEASTMPLVNGDTVKPQTPQTGVQELHTDNSPDVSSALVNPSDLPHADEIFPSTQARQPPDLEPPEPSSASDSTFLAASIDGSLRIWDKRQQGAVAKITPQGVPPWCMNACWSPDGNSIYAGRRNGTVDEYSLHKGLEAPTRNFKLPNNSGAVSAVRAMPNGRHLICSMPKLNDITVHVTSNGKELEEWGTHFFRSRNQVTTFIQSATEQAFQISIKLRLPWQTSEHPSKTRASTTAPGYSLLANLYLDGREEPEKRTILHLDPAHPEYLSDGRYSINRRWIKTAEGALREHVWVFRERAVEDVLQRLNLNRQDDVDVKDENNLAGALESAHLRNIDEELLRSNTKIGQIVIEVEKVIVGPMRVDHNHLFTDMKGRDNDLDMTEAGKDVTHAASLVASGNFLHGHKRIVTFTPYRPEEGFFAAFQFFYRSRGECCPSIFCPFVDELIEQLAKYGFQNFPKSVKAHPPSLNRCMAEATPLCFSTKRKSSKLPNDDPPSCEDKVYSKSLKPDAQLEYKFARHLRDGQTKMCSSGLQKIDIKERHPAIVFPSTPLFKVFDPSGLLPTIDEARSSTSPPKMVDKCGTTMSYLDDLDSRSSSPHTRIKQVIKPFKKEQKLPLLPTSTSTNLEASPAPDSTNSLSEENLNILRPTDEDSFHQAHHESDMEGEADDECATESDLETHADNLGEDEYSLDLEEEAEEADKGLRAGFEKVSLGKRLHAAIGEVDDDDDDNDRDDRLLDDDRCRTSGDHLDMDQGVGSEDRVLNTATGKPSSKRARTKT